jgi:hypothetical protein
VTLRREIVVDVEAAVLPHVQSFPLETWMLAQARLHRGILGEQAWHDFAAAVELVEELAFANGEWEHDGQDQRIVLEIEVAVLLCPRVAHVKWSNGLGLAGCRSPDGVGF